MSDAYNELLDATIQHLENLKSSGLRQVAVAPETLRALAQPVEYSFADFKVQSQPSVAHTPPLRAAAIEKVANPLPAAVALQTTASGPMPATVVETSLPQHSKTTPEPSVALEPQSKVAAFAALRERALACQKCVHLASSRKNVVFGVGNPDAQLMFVGEAPGADEDEQGEPFVGRAGELLTKIIQATGLQRGDVYIANILKCRPDTPGQTSGNRKPTADEMATCIPYLHEQIDVIRPKVLVALGATAVEGLLGKTVGITRLRGHWQTYRGIPLMPTYHPAYLLRNQAVTEKRKVWEDMLAVMAKLELPISEKQRNYFLK